MSRRGTGEGRLIAESKASEIAALDWEQLAAYGKRVDRVDSASGGGYLVKSHAFWDMDAWKSDLTVIVKVYPLRGWRRFRPYKAVNGRRGEDLPQRPGG